MSCDPMLDVLSREDLRERYLDGAARRDDRPCRGGSKTAHLPILTLSGGRRGRTCWCHDDPADHHGPVTP